jgi:hypothetical protein
MLIALNNSGHITMADGTLPNQQQIATFDCARIINHGYSYTTFDAIYLAQQYFFTRFWDTCP